MRFTTTGTSNEYGVTVDKVVLYSTTLTTCQCPANRYHPKDCKHLKSVNAQCACPESVWYVHELDGLVNLCAEALCETSSLKRQALENDGWVKVLEGLLPRKLCFVCEVELMAHLPSLDASMLYCYDGEHRKPQQCRECGEDLIKSDLLGNAHCITCVNQEMPLSVAV